VGISVHHVLPRCCAHCADVFLALVSLHVKQEVEQIGGVLETQTCFESHQLEMFETLAHWTAFHHWPNFCTPWRSFTMTITYRGQSYRVHTERELLALIALLHVLETLAA